MQWLVLVVNLENHSKKIKCLISLMMMFQKDLFHKKGILSDFKAAHFKIHSGKREKEAKKNDEEAKISTNKLRI